MRRFYAARLRSGRILHSKDMAHLLGQVLIALIHGKAAVMSTATHFENAHFLRELADNLPRIYPRGTPDQIDLLQRLANEELAQAEHDDWVRTKVAAARADQRPTFTTAEVEARLSARSERLQRAPR